MHLLKSHWFALLIMLVAFFAAVNEWPHAGDTQKTIIAKATTTKPAWLAPDINTLGSDSIAQQILYGKDLIANTAQYLGPKGSIAAITNGMNCQNCHLGAGAKPYGNCFAAVASIYPVFRPRSGIYPLFGEGL